MTDAQPLARLADEVLTGILEHDPVEATFLGDHRGDGQLTDPSAAAAGDRAAQLRAQLARIDALPAGTVDEQVDLETMRTALAAQLLDLDEIREAEWNPMLHNPGNGLHALLSRPYAPPAQRLAAAVQRLSAVPGYLAAARDRLATMSRIHVRTALSQLDGTIALIEVELPAAAAGTDAPGLDDAARAAGAAVARHQAWLAERLDASTHDPRLGPELFRAKLALALDTAFGPEALLATAQDALSEVSAQLREQAGRLAGVARPDDDIVRAVLDDLATDTADDATILALCRQSLLDATRFVRDRELVTLYDDPIEVVAMPEIDRGVSAAYCLQNGPLEQLVLPTQYAVSPTPADWDAAQVASFYREYNRHMLHNLTVHEAMPGHALQLMHANRYQGATAVRAVFGSGTFIEGWASYTEWLMSEFGYRNDESARAGAAMRIHRLKMMLRTTLNTILDIRYHCDDLSEAEAMSLMTGTGHQELGEATGKWRRVRLTATQLCTYFVGHHEVHAIAADLQREHPQWELRDVHDAMLAHGSPAPRHVRSLLGPA